MTRWAIIFLIMALLPIPTLSRAQETPPLTFLHAEGQQIVNEAGEPILWRGINVHNYYYFYPDWPEPAQNYATEADIAELAAMGANSIRLGLHYRFFDTEFGFQLIDQYLTWCEKYGIYVILDMHVAPPGDDISDARIWTDANAQQTLIDLWVSIASRYADRAVVAGYDLYNEPAPTDAQDWWDLAQRITDEIRQVDTRHIIVAEQPLLWPQPESPFQRLNDTNIVYSYHIYNPFIVSHATADWAGDALVMNTYSYPGDIPDSTEWVQELGSYKFTDAPTDGWIETISGPQTIPAGVDFAVLRASVFGSADVYYDDVWLTVNGEPFNVCNPSMEDPSRDDPARPACWHPYTEGDYTFAWTTEESHSGSYSLKITGTQGFAEWIQGWLPLQMVVPVHEGDVLEWGGWLYARSAESGSGFDITMDLLRATVVYYDIYQLEQDIQIYHTWAQTENVPLWVGEFGSLRHAPGSSGNNLIRDYVTLFNRVGVGWCLWAYRDDGEPNGFSLYYGPPDQPVSASQRDEIIYEILVEGFRAQP